MSQVLLGLKSRSLHLAWNRTIIPSGSTADTIGQLTMAQYQYGLTFLRGKTLVATTRMLLLMYHTLEGGRAWALRYHYDISTEEYDLMFFQQAGVCAICKKAETTYDKRAKRVRSLAVDHDHENGNVRGLLCAGCNKLLGDIESDPERFIVVGSNFFNNRPSLLNVEL